MTTPLRTPGAAIPARVAAADPEPPRFLSQEAYQALLTRIRGMADPPEMLTGVSLDSAWRSDVRWARNRTSLAGEWRNVTVGVQCGGRVLTNQTDPVSLQAGVQWAEEMFEGFQGEWRTPAPRPGQSEQRFFPATHIWSDATYAQSPDERLDVANRLIAGADTAGMLSAGYLSVEAQGHLGTSPDHRLLYAKQTVVQCSMTVRDPAGTGSGWAGGSSYDWGRIDADQLAAIALDKCLKSRNPVAIEPGRYTLIMEPQASFGLLEQFWRNQQQEDYWDLFANESKKHLPFHSTPTTTVAVSKFAKDVILQTTKIGQRVFDERINISFDPLDLDLGCVPFTEGAMAGYPIQPVQWVTNGILTTLSFAPGLGVWQMMTQGHPMDPRGKPNLGSFRMDGGASTTTVDEMIATTERGLLVTRFWGVQLLDTSSVLCTGVTRDGLWLIEHGKISHAVKNLRFTESPLFAFNNVEQIGAAVPIFKPGMPAMTPPIKVRDFSFTALEDAI